MVSLSTGPVGCDRYSALPHKELRFIFHAIPPLNTVAALGLAALYRRWDARRTAGSGIFLLGAVGLLGLSLLASLGFLFVSSRNYTGGEALAALHTAAAAAVPPPRVHIGVEAAMSGVTRVSPHPYAHTRLLALLLMA